MNLTKPKDIYHFEGRNLHDRYLIQEFIAEGGMGLVYKGTDTALDLQVAVKILHPKFLGAADRAEIYLGLFRRETDLLSTLDHRNIVKIIDSGVQDEVVYFVMEWLSGLTLSDRIHATGRLPVEMVESVLGQVCEALDAAHRRKIVHLDLKPSNIFLLDTDTGHEHIKIIDFGLSRIVQSTLGSTLSRQLGTPQYMAPEIYRNKASFRSDIYSLGIILYEMLTGVLPYGNSHLYALMADQITAPPPSAKKINPEVTEYIDALIRDCLSKSPSSRPHSAGEVHLRYKRGIVHQTWRAHVPILSLKDTFRENIRGNTIVPPMRYMWERMLRLQVQRNNRPMPSRSERLRNLAFAIILAVLSLVSVASVFAIASPYEVGPYTITQTKGLVSFTISSLICISFAAFLINYLDEKVDKSRLLKLSLIFAFSTSIPLLILVLSVGLLLGLAYALLRRPKRSERPDEPS